MLFSYLIVNAIMYIIFGAWCAYSPQGTAAGVGFTLLGDKGVAEYVAVYGGLEFGVGIFYLLCALNPSLNQIGVLFSLCFYSGIVLFRTFAILRLGSDISTGWVFYSLEILLTGCAWYLYKSSAQTIL